MPRRQFYLIFAIAFVIRLTLVIKSDFWYDENFSIILANLPFSQMLDATAGDVHPPLYYTLLWVWVNLVGDSPLWFVRLPSLAFSLGSIVMIDRLTSRAEFPARLNTAAVLMMAFVPFQVYYSAETRMYALLGFLVLCGVETVLNRQWARLAIIAAALAYTHNWGLLYDAGLFVLAIATNPPRTWKLIPIPFLVAALLWVPWAYTMFGQMSAIDQSYWLTRVTPGLALLQLHQLVFGMVLYNPLGAIAVFSLLLLGGYFLIQDHARAAGLLLIMWLVPFGLGVLVSILWQPILLFRAMSGIAPFLYLVMLWPVTRLTTPRRALLLAVFILPLLLMSYRSLYFGVYKADGTESLAYIQTHWQAGDVILTSSDMQYVNLRNQTSYPLILLQECRRPLGGLTDRTRAAMEFNIQPFETLSAARVWFLYARTPLHHQCNLDQAEQIIGQTQPSIIETDDGLIFAGLWLLEK